MQQAGAGLGAHSKAPPRKKKGASGAGQGQQQRKARSASASIAVPLRSAEVVEAEHAMGMPAGKGVASGGPQHPPQQSLPPRSPVKAAKVCVPTLEDALDDVQVRFVLNLPEAELSSADRLFFQLEQAWWFYEDFIADAHKHLPHFKLKEFAKLLFEHCEALRPLSGKYNELFEYFRSWKGTIPTAGCVLLNAAMTDVVLVKCWKGNSRGLPKGKINQGEPAIDAALREVQEETGYDARRLANEKDFLTLYINGQQTTMYIIVGVDETFPFEPQVRKEISAIEWFPLDALPKGSFGVEPFIPRLRRWMAKTKGVRAPKNSATPEARTQSLLRVRKARATSPDVSSAAAVAVASTQSQPSSPTGVDAASSNGTASSKKPGRKGSKAAAGVKDHSSAGGADNVRSCSAPNRRGGGGGHHAKAKGFDRRNHDTFGGGGEDANGGGGGGGDGWDFEAMLAANERLTGRTFVYDGNPHDFGDPAHAARVSAPGTATTTATTAATAGAPTGDPEPSRSEDLVVHVKQWGGGAGGGAGHKNGNNKHKSGKGGGGRQADAITSSAPAAGDFPTNGKGRSRSRGKARDGAKAQPSSSSSLSNANGATGAVEAPGDGPAAAAVATNMGNGGSFAATVDLGAPASRSSACSQAVGSLCTEGAGEGGGAGQAGAGGAPVVSLWGDTPAAGTSSAGGAGANVFGDFKFDLLDIMSAVPQG